MTKQPSWQEDTAMPDQRLRWPQAAAVIAALSVAGWLLIALLVRWILRAIP